MEPQESPATRPPVALLVATTDEARHSLGDKSTLRIATFPYRVGRESRVASSAPSRSADLRLGVAPQLNDIYLLDPWRKHLQISHEHFAIEYTADGFFLLDRGSACGTIVAGRHVGGDRTGGRTELRSGDEIVVGTDTSPFVFRFEIATD